MGYEIELKAWVDDWEAIETTLRSRCRFIRRFHKSDRYFRSPHADGRPASFRLREEDTRACVTFKTKTIRDGIEYNREREFMVDDSAAFVELVRRSGCEEYASKTKTGLEFRSDGMTIELTTVGSIGDFIEVEILESSDDPRAHARAARRIRQVLADTGISVHRIESRPYLALLSGEEISKDLSRA